MDEFLINEVPEEGNAPPETSFYLATVYSWNNTDGMRITLDGESEPSTKSYKVMYMCRPLHAGARVVVMKQSGTYIVLGEIGLPTTWKKIENLSYTATDVNIISKINEIIATLRTQGMVWTD